MKTWFFGVFLLQAACSFLLAAPLSGVSVDRAKPVMEQFGVATDGTPLTWLAYLVPGPGTHPNVIIIHGGGFNSDENSPQQLVCAQDLVAAGMNAFIISYRLAPPGSILGQQSDGRYPDQTDDVHLAVRAARNDPRGNRKVGAVGGSAGGAHLVYVAATGMRGDDQIDVGVSLSGAYNYGDQASWVWQTGDFYGWVSNYVGATDAATLTADSPISFVNAHMPPLLLYASASEAMPPQQIVDLKARLDALRVKNYQEIILAGHSHSFAYWRKVQPAAVAFLLNVLKP